MFKNVSKSLKWLIIFLAVVVIASLGASLVQNSFFSVKVEKISFETDRGELSGYLYTPRGVDANNPAPAIVTTHGYLNNAEMQEITAIEMSRRGYVVLAFDMYDHGDSKWDTPAQFSFYVYAVYDAVQYMYNQNFVLKDASGNGMIAVSGHSMGGFASTCAVYLDEVDFATNGFRKITVALPVGSDMRYIPFPSPIDSFGPRSAGIIAAHYDQFFFDNSGTAPGSVVYKDFVTDAVGLAFLGRTDEGTAEAGVFYDEAGGQRVIYTPDETHPQNTWSLESGANTIEFYDEAFTFQLNLGGLNSLESYGIDTTKTGQVWWLKEGFTLVALLGLFAMMFPLFSFITSLPLFKKGLATEGQIVESKPLNTCQLVVKIFLIEGATFLSFYLLTRFMNRAPSLDNLVSVLDVLMIVAGVAALVLWGYFFIKKDNEVAAKIKKLALRISIIAASVVIVSLAYRWLLVNRGTIIQTDHYYSAPSINTIVFWAMASGGLILLISLLANVYFNWNQEDKNPLGLKASPIQIAVGLLNAIVMTVGVLFLVALIGWIFKTDFRFYTYAIQIFNSQQFVAALRYIPLFFVYYFAASISVFMNTKAIKGWLGDVLAAFLLAGPIVLFLIYQYNVLYTTGTAVFPTFSLSAILTVGLVPTLSVAGIIMRRLGQKTGNIWTAAFFTTIFFTLITLANTTVYLLAAV